METKKKAKMNALMSLKDAMSQLIGSDIKGGMKKVTVAADDEKGLKKGLDKAKEMLGLETADEEGELCDECGMKHEGGHDEEAEKESPELESSEGKEEESLEDLKKQLEDLKAKITAKMVK